MPPIRVEQSRWCEGKDNLYDVLKSVVSRASSTFER